MKRISQEGFYIRVIRGPLHLYFVCLRLRCAGISAISFRLNRRFLNLEFLGFLLADDKGLADLRQQHGIIGKPGAVVLPSRNVWHERDCSACGKPFPQRNSRSSGSGQSAAGNGKEKDDYGNTYIDILTM